MTRAAVLLRQEVTALFDIGKPIRHDDLLMMMGVLKLTAAPSIRPSRPQP